MPRRGKARKQRYASIYLFTCLTVSVRVYICVVILERNLLYCSYGRMVVSPYVLKPLPSGVPVPMCFCGDPCKVEISEDEATYKQRY
jgi:hypothetical protein